MRKFDVVIIGGGPAGSACAAKLVDSGVNVAVLDREDFPRTKLCAGWITPEVVEDLDLDVEAYPYRFNTFEHIVVHIKGLSFNFNAPQHSIRRHEFDDYLLKKSGAEIINHNVKGIEKKNGAYLIDEDFECKYLVGAGGTRCPVYRNFFREANPRAVDLQVATYEHEFPYEWSDPRCHLWFFERGLPGYAWYVPKENGYLNCGVGGMANSMKVREQDIKTHWSHFVATLEDAGLVREVVYKPRGYSYFLRGNVDVVRVENAFIAGDSVGLASIDLGEGIGPAVRSGHLAAQSIVTGSEYSLAGIDDMTIQRNWLRWLIRKLIKRYGTDGLEGRTPGNH
jgi:flavin-dependent dehydrogenase